MILNCTTCNLPTIVLMEEEKVREMQKPIVLCLGCAITLIKSMVKTPIEEELFKTIIQSIIKNGIGFDCGSAGDQLALTRASKTMREECKELYEIVKHIPNQESYTIYPNINLN